MKHEEIVTQLSSVYEDCCEGDTHVHTNQWKLSATEEKGFTDAVASMVERVWKEKGLPEGDIDKPVVAEFAKRLWTGVEKGYGKKLTEVDFSSPDNEMLAALQKNVWQFSAAKNYQQLRALTDALIGDDGKLRSYKDFKLEAFKINDQYINQWLQTEYDLAVSGSQMAAKWVNITAQSDTLTLLEFDAVIDSRTSDLCRSLNKTILPINDPFWKTYYPPNHFKCRSTVWQRQKGKITPADKIPSADIPPMFRVNLAQEQLVFPPKHPYYDKLPSSVENSLKDVLPKDPVTNLNDLNKYFKTYASENPDDFKRGFHIIAEERNARNNGSTDSRGTIFLKKDRLNNVIESLNRKNSTFEQEDSLSTLWHEINHNKNIYGSALMNKTQRFYMECANEFVSRKTLPDFIAKLGKEFSNPILTEDRKSTGYNTMVKNIDYLFKKAGLEKEGLELMKKLAYDTRYDKIHQDMINETSGLLVNLNKKIKPIQARRIVRLCVEAGQKSISTNERVDMFFKG